MWRNLALWTVGILFMGWVAIMLAACFFGGVGYDDSQPGGAAMSDFSAEQIAAAQRMLRHRASAFAARVAPIYRLLNWEWERLERGYIGATRRYVPSEAQIFACLCSLIDEVPSSHSGCISTGGLQVAIDWADTDHTTVEATISFSLDDTICDAVDDAETLKLRGTA